MLAQGSGRLGYLAFARDLVFTLDAIAVFVNGDRGRWRRDLDRQETFGARAFEEHGLVTRSGYLDGLTPHPGDRRSEGVAPLSGLPWRRAARHRSRSS